MKYLVCADIHTYLNNLTKAIDSVGRDNIDGVIFAGDLESDWSELRSRVKPIPRLYYVYGNNDAYFNHRDPENIPEERILKICGHSILLTHGNKYHVPRLKMLVSAAKKKGCGIVIFGHTHKAVDDTVSGVRLLNPGALMSRPTGQKGSYMVLDLFDDGAVSVEERNLP